MIRSLKTASCRRAGEIPPVPQRRSASRINYRSIARLTEELQKEKPPLAFAGGGLLVG